MKLEAREITRGLRFPEGPIALPDGSVLVVEIEGARLIMPDRLPDEEFDLPDAKLLGYIYDPQGKRLWQSRSAEDESIDYQPRLNGHITEFRRVRDANGVEYFVYDVELRLTEDEREAFSFVTMQPTSEYRSQFEEFRRQLDLWLGGEILRTGCDIRWWAAW